MLALKGYLGDAITVVAINSYSVEVESPGATTIQVVPKKDFKAVSHVWEAYKQNQIQRQEIREMTRFSKYIISILHWLEMEE
jgi:hypothetical protein